MTIEQTTKQWLKMLAARVKRRTLVRYRGIIARHIYPHLDVTVPFEEDGLPEGWSSSWNSKNGGVVTYVPVSAGEGGETV